MRRKFTKSDQFFYDQNLYKSQRYMNTSTRTQMRDRLLSNFFSYAWGLLWRLFHGLKRFNRFKTFDRVKAFLKIRGEGDHSHFLANYKLKENFDVDNGKDGNQAYLDKSKRKSSKTYDVYEAKKVCKSIQETAKRYEKYFLQVNKTNLPGKLSYELEFLETTSISKSTENETFHTPIRTYRPGGRSRDDLKKIIYVHGGGYVIDMRNHYYLNSLTLSLNAEIQSIDYTLTTEKKLPYSIDECVAAINVLLNRESDKSVTLLGDSAGAHAILNAGFELAQLKDTSSASTVNLPKNIYLLNPWVAINQISESFCIPHSVRCSGQKLKSSYVLHGLYNRDCTDEESILMAKMQQGILSKEEIRDSGDEKAMELYDFINDPKISLNERSNEDIELLVNSGINFHFELSDHDGNIDEGEDFYDRFVQTKTKLCTIRANDANGQNNQQLSKITKRVAKGFIHCWFIFLPSQTRWGFQQPAQESWAPEHDQEFYVLTNLIKERL